VRHKAMVEDVVSRWSLAGEAPFAPGGPQVVGERVVLWPPVQTLSPASDQVEHRPTWRILMSSGSHSYRGQMGVCNFSTKLALDLQVDPSKQERLERAPITLDDRGVCTEAMVEQSPQGVRHTATRLRSSHGRT